MASPYGEQFATGYDPAAEALFRTISAAVHPCRLPSSTPRAVLLMVVRAAPPVTANSPSSATIAADGSHARAGKA